MRALGIRVLLTFLSLTVLISCFHSDPAAGKYIGPHLKKKDNVTQLIVENEPFVILGGELGNSSFTSEEYMRDIWPKLKAMNVNTVLAPVYWELIEPAEGVFDFDLIDRLIIEARLQNLKLVLLWFGSWKNSMSCHVPSWIKLDQERFPRIKDANGRSHEILTPFHQNNLNADVKAFETLMEHIRLTDVYHSVIMVQVENEIGMLPSARDYSSYADEFFYAPVPEGLLQYMMENKDLLVPEFHQIWQKNGYKTDGTWEEIFGRGLHTDEIFMAWYYARFTNKVVEAGKLMYSLPMFVNAALNAPGRKPGEYPSAGPLPHLIDIWKAGAPAIDFLSPDFYNPDFRHWSDLYYRQDNPLFIPEHRFDETVAAKAAFAIGHYQALGFAPFSIESAKNPEDEDLGKMYNIIHQLTPLITKNHGSNNINGVYLDKEHPEDVVQFGDYELTFRHSYTLGWEPGAQNDTWEPAGAIIIQTSGNEFYIGGTGVVATFRYLPESLEVGILKTDEGRFENDKWIVTRHLNGDQTHQGRHLRIFREDFAIQRIKLYTYK